MKCSRKQLLIIPKKNKFLGIFQRATNSSRLSALQLQLGVRPLKIGVKQKNLYLLYTVKAIKKLSGSSEPESLIGEKPRVLF
jgi:hypothetical protein